MRDEERALEASEEAVAAADAYERLHVPALFRQWTPLMIEAASIGPGDRVLDVACGTGVLAREVAGRVGEQGAVAGIDPAPGMLALARRLAPRIDWRPGTAEALPFADRSFDAVVSQFGMMFFADRAAAIREMLRVLAPGGRLAVAVWEALERSEAYPTLVEILDRIGGVAAGDALRAPFVLGDREALGELFRAAGAGAVGMVTYHRIARFPDIRTMVEADLRGWLPVMGVTLEEAQIEEILAESERALAQHVIADGTVQFDLPAHVVTAART